MTSTMLAVATAAALMGGGVLALAPSMVKPPFTDAAYVDDQARIAPQRIIIGLDLSKSNPLIDDPQFAAKVGARVASMVRNLGFASEVHVRTFGSYDASANNFHYDAVLSIRERPEAVAADVERVISGTPLLIRHGRWQAQNWTNILAFMDNMSRSVGCSGMPTTIILASDGIEDSEYAHLDDPHAHLPAPDGRPFAGCAELDIFGIGQGTRSPSKTERLRYEWTRWAQAAGFGRFSGLNDW
ncbi:MAG: hypothetical protein ABSD74_12600 [Rhizomicrobium sp.]